MTKSAPEASANLLSLVMTARANGVEPFNEAVIFHEWS